MRKQRIRAALFLVIVVLNILALCACGEKTLESGVSVSAVINGSSGAEEGGEYYTALDVGVTITNDIEEMNVSSCVYRIYFKDISGAVLAVEEIEMPGTAATGEQLSNTTSHKVLGHVSTVSAVAVSMDVTDPEPIWEKILNGVWMVVVSVLALAILAGIAYWFFTDGCWQCC